MTKQKIFTSYYILISVLSLGLVMRTIFVASLFVDYGYRLQKLQVQQRNNVAYQAELTQQLASELSLQTAYDFAAAQDFMPVTHLVSIDISQTHLAAR